MCKTKKSRSQARIESLDALAFVHLASSIPGVVIVPGGAVTLDGFCRYLGHETSLDDPDWVGRESRAGAGRDR